MTVGSRLILMECNFEQNLSRKSTNTTLMEINGWLRVMQTTVSQIKTQQLINVAYKKITHPSIAMIKVVRILRTVMGRVT